MGKEYLTFRFGFVAVKEGFATPEQVSKALEIQIEENLKAKKHRRLGEILVEMGFMSATQVDLVLAAMTKST